MYIRMCIRIPSLNSSPPHNQVVSIAASDVHLLADSAVTPNPTP